MDYDQYKKSLDTMRLMFDCFGEYMSTVMTREYNEAYLFMFHLGSDEYQNRYLNHLVALDEIEQNELKKIIEA